MILSQIVRHFEGLHLRAYLCPAGVPTIGYGATGPDIKLGMVWTEAQCDERLERDCARASQSAINLCPQLNSQGKLLAVSDFTYNLGATRLAASTLRRRIRLSDWAAAADQFPRWVRGGGRVLPGLVSRRAFERQLFLGA
jgi:lysozyme